MRREAEWQKMESAEKRKGTHEALDGNSQQTEPLVEIVFPRFRKFSQEALSPRMIGFAFSRAWVYTAFTSTLLLQPFGQKEIINLLYILSLVALVASLLIGGLSEKRCRRLMATRVGKLLPAGLSILGTTTLVFSNFDTAFGVLCLIVASLATGMGSGLFILYWGRVYSKLGGPVAAAETSVAFIIATLPVALFLILPPILQLMIVTLLPIASSLVLFRVLEAQPTQGDIETTDSCPQTADRPDPVKPLAKSTSSCPQTADRPDTNHHHKDEEGWNLEIIGLNWKRVLLKFTSGSIIFGCVVSLMHEMYPADGGDIIGISSGTTLFISAFIAGSVTLAILFFSKRLDLAFTYRPVLIFMSLGCLLLPFIGYSGGITWTLTMAGYLCFEIMNWVALSDMAFRFEIPALRAFGYGRAAVSGGVLLGAFLAQWFINSGLAVAPQGSVALSFAMVFVLIITYTFTLTERDVAKITRVRARVPFRESDERSPISLEDKVLVLAEEYGISGRGLEVLMLLAKGRTGTRIEQELYMSRGTVNTHLRRLYQKLGVHTRQDLLDLIDSHNPNKP
jgi:DNA-binding CsgD family transcriptional regulator